MTEVRASLFNCDDLEEDEEGEEELIDVAALSDDFRGFIGPHTAVYLDSQTANSRLQIVNSPSLPHHPADVVDPRVVQILTSDGKRLVCCVVVSTKIFSIENDVTRRKLSGEATSLETMCCPNLFSTSRSWQVQTYLYRVGLPGCCADSRCLLRQSGHGCLHFRPGAVVSRT